MVIATSGKGSSISYTIIISSTSSNSYSVVISDSKTFRDSTLPISKLLRGLFVVDMNNLVALIYDLSTFKTNVGTLNLITPSISYQASLPIIRNMYTGVFMTASVYYTASFDYRFYKDYTNKENFINSINHGIVYTSDMSMS